MKKLFLTAALFLSLTGAASAAPVQDGESGERSTNVEVVEITSTEIVLPADDAALTAGDVAGEEVHESKVAKKMTQAEKAHNAEVNDPWGGAITIIAMTIVVSALLILSLLFLGFGKISESLMNRRKKAAKAAANHTTCMKTHMKLIQANLLLQ